MLLCMLLLLLLLLLWLLMLYKLIEIDNIMLLLWTIMFKINSWNTILSILYLDRAISTHVLGFKTLIRHS